jgi:drug/metabolite transporter (DMT)-like permease
VTGATEPPVGVVGVVEVVEVPTPLAPPGLEAAGAEGAAAPAAAASVADRHRLANYATLGLLTLIWGTTWAAIRIGLRGMAPFTGVALRFAIGAAALAAVGRGLGVRLWGAPPTAAGRPRPSPWRVWLANGLLTFFIPYGVLYWAEQWVPSGVAAVLFATSPLWVALAAHLALPAERLRAATAAGILIGFAGVALIFSEDLRALGGPRVAGAAALLLVAPLTSAFGVVAVKRWSAGMHPLAIVTAPMGMAAAGMGCLALAGESGQPPRLSGLPLAALLYLALIGTALAFTLYFWLLGRLPATTLSLINYLTPIVALLVGGVALGEPVTTRILAGSALVVGGVAAAMRVRSGVTD